MGSLFRFFRIALPVALIITAAILVPYKLLDARGVTRVDRLELELRQLNETNRSLIRDNDALRSKIRAFHSDPEYMEKVARDELGMVGPSEIIYQFPEVKNPK